MHEVYVYVYVYVYPRLDTTHGLFFLVLFGRMVFGGRCVALNYRRKRLS